ncbi:srtx-1 [Pristionchus pacificus]|uniref:G_PROTEIN_RECEP_F1_2 domain-containing protein n=1 Tax=Pristionchus pacificus TaxID=54126 RepID=A0A2A6CLK3_PRIPA|nr:srtx-1 [Pristionchus pacificus]|eukprot:PDM78923.1 hypothetical protein PRIPAC_31502 [Pristionchus pacificus]
MMEDAIYEILPVVGFAAILSGAFVLIILWKEKGNPRIFMFFAVSDIINGIALISCGFYGVVVTMTGAGSDNFHPSSCLFYAPHLLLWAYTDTTEVLCILLFLIDRTIQIITPVSYGTISKTYLTLKYGFILYGVGTFAFIPTFFETITVNSTYTISTMCRFEQVVLPRFLEVRLFTVLWLPVIGMVWTMLIFLAYLIRRSKQRWSYNWSEKFADTQQMIAIAFLRCLFTEVAVKIVLYGNTNEVVVLRDFLLRAALALLVSFLSPCIYMLFSTPFTHHFDATFNVYGKNTERTWQSANDPPDASDNGEIGSPFEMKGTMREHACAVNGFVPRSASFYFESPPASLFRRPCPPALSHKSENVRGKRGSRDVPKSLFNQNTLTSIDLSV